MPPQLLAGSLAAVTCQRLIRQICRICRAPAEPPAPQTLAHHGIAAEEAATLRFFRGKGCPTCNKVGYRGRRAIFEVMTGAPEVRSALQNGLPADEIESIAVGAGMTHAARPLPRPRPRGRHDLRRVRQAASVGWLQVGSLRGHAPPASRSTTSSGESLVVSRRIASGARVSGESRRCRVGVVALADLVLDRVEVDVGAGGAQLAGTAARPGGPGRRRGRT